MRDQPQNKATAAASATTIVRRIRSRLRLRGRLGRNQSTTPPPRRASSRTAARRAPTSETPGWDGTWNTAQGRAVARTVASDPAFLPSTRRVLMAGSCAVSGKPDDRRSSIPRTSSARIESDASSPRVEETTGSPRQESVASTRSTPIRRQATMPSDVVSDAGGRQSSARTNACRTRPAAVNARSTRVTSSRGQAATKTSRRSPGVRPPAAKSMTRSDNSMEDRDSTCSNTSSGNSASDTGGRSSTFSVAAERGSTTTARRPRQPRSRAWVPNHSTRRSGVSGPASSGHAQVHSWRVSMTLPVMSASSTDRPCRDQSMTSHGPFTE